jgi:hypothetical protein
MMRLQNQRSSRPLSILLSFALLLHFSTAVIVADFSYYPSGSQSCLNSAATSSKCDQSTVALFNACVCSNGGGFIDSTAKCLGTSSPGDLTTVYTVLSRNCGDSNTPVDYSLDKFLAAASVKTATASATTTVVSSVVTVTQSGTTKTSTQLSTMVTSVAPSPILSTITVATTNAAGQTTGVATVLTLAPIQSASAGSAGPSSSNSSSSSSKGGLSSGAVIGIGVGVGVPIALALFGLIGVLIWRGKKKNKAENAANNGFAPSKEPDSSAATLQSDSPYAHPAGVAAYKQSPYQPPTQYDQTQYNTQDGAYNYTRPIPQHNGYGGIPVQPPPVEMHGTSVENRPHELPGSAIKR